MNARSRYRVACLGVASWDRLLTVDRYPPLGRQAVVSGEVSAPGGTTTNTAVALARLGLEVRLAAAVGDDERGRSIRERLAAEGVDTSWLLTRPSQATNSATVVVSAEPLDRTMFWQAGAGLTRGDRLPIAELFGHDLVVLDPSDLELRRFLLDLPAHTLPRTRLLGPLTYLADPALHDALDLALRHDVVVGDEGDALTVTGTWTLADATAALQSRMRGQNLRAAAITRGTAGCRIVTPDESFQVPAFEVTAVDPTGAGDAFVAAVAFGLVQRWDWPRIGRFANAAGALATLGVGAQSSLPDRGAIDDLLNRNQ
ncbi:MAG: carbohydrate kinase family protein [Chloroflexota bacterium]|nr:carbohydrate kinase family protein [Chloroflexota bacterium]